MQRTSDIQDYVKTLLAVKFAISNTRKWWRKMFDMFCFIAHFLRRVFRKLNGVRRCDVEMVTPLFYKMKNWKQRFHFPLVIWFHNQLLKRNFNNKLDIHGAEIQVPHTPKEKQSWRRKTEVARCWPLAIRMCVWTLITTCGMCEAEKNDQPRRQTSAAAHAVATQISTETRHIV